MFVLLFLICFVDFFKERKRQVGRLWEELEKRKNEQNRLHEIFLKKKKQRLTVQNSNHVWSLLFEEQDYDISYTTENSWGRMKPVLAQTGLISLKMF